MKKIVIILVLLLLSGCNRTNVQTKNGIGSSQLEKTQLRLPSNKVLELSIKDTEVLDTYFENTAFVGDSRLIDIHKFEAIKSGYLFSEVALGINKLDTKLITTPLSKDKLTVFDALKLHQFDRIYLSFGFNELGYGYPEIFIEQYTQVIKTIKAIEPKADIVVLLIFPLSAEKDALEKEMNNQRVAEYNLLIEAMAIDLNIYYFKDYSSLIDDQGFLIKTLTEDGVHLNSEGYQLWADALRKATIEVNNE